MEEESARRGALLLDRARTRMEDAPAKARVARVAFDEEADEDAAEDQVDWLRAATCRGAAAFGSAAPALLAASLAALPAVDATMTIDDLWNDGMEGLRGGRSRYFLLRGLTAFSVRPSSRVRVRDHVEVGLSARSSPSPCLSLSFLFITNNTQPHQSTLACLAHRE